MHHTKTLSDYERKMYVNSIHSVDHLSYTLTSVIMLAEGRIAIDRDWERKF